MRRAGSGAVTGTAVSAVSALVIVALALAGCSQIDALAPVGGAEIADLRYATNEVLLEQGVEILVAPVCEGAGGELHCAGETAGGEAITSTATSADASSFELRIGDRVLFAGPVQGVLDRNGTVGAR